VKRLLIVCYTHGVKTAAMAGQSSATLAAGIAAGVR